jgi:Mg/Co/Ni transporter MgtE
LRVVHAAVGIKSMIRRLGFEKIFGLLQSIFRFKVKFLEQETVINWKYVLAVPDQSVQQHVRLSLSLEDFKGLHPADLADILEDLSNKGREAIFRELDPELAAETLSEIDLDMQMTLLKNEAPDKAAEIIENMSPEDAADILNEMNDDRADAILAEIDDIEIQDEIKELLDYEEESAGGLMTPNFFSFEHKQTKDEILQLIRNNRDEVHHNGDIFVTNEAGRLIGVCSFLDLLISDENLTINALMHSEDIKFVSPSDHWKTVIDLMNKYNLVNIPVIDQDEKLLGVVFIDELLPWMLNEK